MSYACAVFDMDGLLLDTERVCLDCFEKAAERVGYPVFRNVYLQCIGLNREQTRQVLIAGHPADFPFTEIALHWRSLYAAETELKAVPVKAGVRQLLTRIAQNDVPLAIATSTDTRLARLKLQNSGLLEFFSSVTCGDQVARGKPEPDIYLAAASAQGVPPRACIAFEDSAHGVRAALAAGMTVIQVPDLVPPDAELKALGHRITGSLADIDWPITVPDIL